MAFRADLGAARARAEHLSEELARLSAREAAGAAALARAREELALAQKEVRRLEAYAPGSASLRAAPYRTALWIGLGLAIATGVAGSWSERLGVNMSYLAVLPLAAGVGGWIGARRSKSAALTLAAIAAVLGLVTLFAFYTVIWPEL